MNIKTIGNKIALVIAAMCSVGGGVLILSPMVGSANTVHEQKATEKPFNYTIPFKNYSVGGLDLVHEGEYGMSPMEYGIKFGSGGRKHSNKLRYSHNAKIKRRKK